MTNRRRPFKRAAVLVCTILLPTFAGTGVATAATDFNGLCEAGEFCLYDSGGGVGRAFDTSAPCRYTYSDRGFDDRASAWWNRMTGTVRIYEDSQYRGLSADLLPGSRGNLVNTPVGDNAASSHRAAGAICPLG